MTKCLIKCLITYFYYLTDDYVVRLFCHLSNVYRELLEPSLINRILILNCPFNNTVNVTKRASPQHTPILSPFSRPDNANPLISSSFGPVPVKTTPTRSRRRTVVRRCRKSLGTTGISSKNRSRTVAIGPVTKTQ